MKKSLIFLVLITLSGCAAVDTVKRYWPRAHDPIMFDNLVSLAISIEEQDCQKPNWAGAVEQAQHLSRYTQWRGDPQAENLKSLHQHLAKLNQGGSKMFCELGKSTAKQRVEAAKEAWKAR